jgi:hypothetical protein
MMAGGIAFLERFRDGTYEEALRVITQRYLGETGAEGRTASPLLAPSETAAIQPAPSEAGAG